MIRPRARLIFALAFAIVLVAYRVTTRTPAPPAPPPPERPTPSAFQSTPKAKPVIRPKPARPLQDEGPAPMVILEELVINQEHRGIGASPDIDAAVSKLPVLEKCVEEPLEIVRLPSLDSHIRMHVGILKRFKKTKEARAWLERAKVCAPHARMEIIKAYFLE